MSRATMVPFGFAVPSGTPVGIPLRHLVITGQTQEAGKTTALEALVARSGCRALAFVTKRGEGAFRNAQLIAPYFREQTDWRYVAAVLEASEGQKLKFERPWIMRAVKGARTLAEVQAGVPHLARRAMHGFRRRVAGDILEATRDAKLALDFIGDSDLRQAARYLQPRDSRMEEAAGIVDGAAAPAGSPPNCPICDRPLTVGTDGALVCNQEHGGRPKPSTKRQRNAPEFREGGARVVATALSQQARQDLNLQPPHVTPDFSPAKPRKRSTKSRRKSASPKQKHPKTTPKPSTNRQRGRPR